MKNVLAWTFGVVVLLLLMVLPGIVVMSVVTIANTIIPDRKGGGK